jgi:hypothetical protein
VSEPQGPHGPDEPTTPVGDELPPDLVAALRAPGSAEELADEAWYVGAFRQQQQTVLAPVVPAQRGPRRLNVRRLGTGGTAVVVAVALTGGVAAAYTGSLPDPVQSFAHVVIGAPAPSPERRTPAATDEATDDASPAPASASASPSAGPSDDPGASQSSGADPSGEGSGSGDPSPTTGGGSQGSGPSRTPSPSEEPSSSPSPVLDPPTALTMSGSSHLASFGTTISLSGRLTTVSGAPAAGRKVVLLVRDAGGWAAVAKVTADGSGNVTATSRSVTGAQHYRWRAKPAVKSGTWRVKVKAAMSATADVGDTTTTITAATVGAAAGDTVELYTRVGGRLVKVGQAAVSPGGTVSFQFPTPARKRPFGVRLVPTKDHTSARAKVTVTPTAGKPVVGVPGVGVPGDQSPSSAASAERPRAGLAASLDNL